MYLSNTTVFYGRYIYIYIYSIYYIRYNYMFRRLTMAIFRLYMKFLVSSMLFIINLKLYQIYYVLYIVELGGEVGRKYRMCLEVGRCGYMGILLFYIVSKLIQLGLWYHIVCVIEYVHIYTYTYTMCNIIQNHTKCGFYSYGFRFSNLFNLLLYYTFTINQVRLPLIYLFNFTK